MRGQRTTVNFVILYLISKGLIDVSRMPTVSMSFFFFVPNWEVLFIYAQFNGHVGKRADKPVI